MFRRLLIANRGEIALRIIRTAREMGLDCVAVFSDVDSKALHTRMAHVAVPLEGTLPGDTYLRIDKIIDAARRTNADAVHPGYGFLSENDDFARAVRDAGITWIGPPPEAIEAMGDKITARRAAENAGVPIVPGIMEPLQDAKRAREAAEKVGYPIALKAAGGGGGKGIRIVRESSQIESAFRACTGEAKSAFGDDRIYLERYLDSPRHVEIQVLFDSHGNGVHFGERECSIQRRHQKLLEESPSVAIDSRTRERMGQAALAAARAVGYVNAGTVEFLMSPSRNTPRSSERGAKPPLDFFFLEMNTRLQVEHPVTEMVAGVDLVREQIRIAAGEPLGYTQSDLRFRGHAIEIRLNAEDPHNGFLPSTGTIRNLRMPGGPGIRLDLGLYRGMEVGVSYDPLLAKIVAWGETRDLAIARMIRALQELNVGGVRTSAPAALAVLEDPRFQSGDFDTRFLETIDLSKRHGQEDETVAAAAAIWRHRLAQRRALSTSAADRSGWLARSRAASLARSRSIGPSPRDGAEGS